jgi:hypothetical protein
MTSQFFTAFHSKQSIARWAASFTLLVFTSLWLVPEAAAQCTGTFPGTPTAGGVVIQDCTIAIDPANVTSVTLAVPGSPALGDLLIAAIAVDEEENYTTPAGWVAVQTGSSDENSLAVFKRISDGSEPASYNFTWSSAEEVAAFMLHITGVSGLVQSSIRSSNGTDATAPAERVKGVATGDLIIRIGGFDGTGTAGSTGGGHILITQTESSNSGANATRVYGWYESSPGADSGNQNIDQSVAQEYVTVTLGIQQSGGANFTSCPTIDGSISGSQLVILEQCTFYQGGNDNDPDGGGPVITANGIYIDKPALAQVGDLLVATISTDGNELPLGTSPVADGFTLINEDEGDGITFATYSRIVDGTEPDNYEWFLADEDQRTAYIMLFSGASGTVIQSTPAFSEAATNDPNPPPIETFVDDTLIVRMATSDDDDITVTPGAGNILAGHTNVVARSSREGGAAVSTQAAYVNLPVASTPGTNDTASLFPLNTADEYWKSSTIGIEPIEFLFAHDGTLSTCAIQEVTISVVNSAGIVRTGFTGTVQLSTSDTAGGNGTWAVGTTADPPEFPGNLDNTAGGSTTNGEATYTFTSGDAGSVTLEFTTDTVGDLSFDLLWEPDGTRNFRETNTPARDPLLVVDNNCEFRIEHDGSAGTCSAGELITFTLVDSDGAQAENYTGTMDVTLDLGSNGSFAVDTGNGTLFPDPDNDDNGAVQYTFDATDNGQVILLYENDFAANYNFDAEDTTNSYLTDTDSPGLYDPDLTIASCEIRVIVADTTSDVCSIILVTIEVRDAGGGLITNFGGDVDLNVNGVPTGDWFLNGEPGTLDNNVGGTGNGQANYDFNGTEGGDITLQFRTITVQTAPDPLLNFDLSGTADNGSPLVQNGSFDPDVDVAACTLTISTPSNTGDVCRNGLTVIYTITDRDSGTATDFNGLVVLQTSGLPDIGDYELAAAAPSPATGGYGTFDNLAANDGVATYQFDPVAGDAGVLEVLYDVQAANSIDLTAASAGITVDDTDGSVTFNDCEFRITFIDATPGTTDVCSTEIVEIRLVDSGGVTVDDYTGTILLSTNTGDGTWAVSNAEGAVFDPTPEDGAASYAFVDDGPGGGADDDGVIELVFTHTASNNASVNIDVDDGTTTDPGNPGSAFDPNLFVDLCFFEISFDGGTTHNDANKTACDVQQVTLEIYRSAGQGGGLATDYAGEVDITTTTNNGNWAIGTGNGSLVDTPGDDDGAATYTFSGISDGGTVTLDYTNLNAQTVGIDLIDQVGGLDGVITEAGSADPDLLVTSCTPVISELSCDQGPSPLSNSVTIDPQESDPALRGRMVVVATAMDGDGDVTSVTFDGVPMTLIRDERADGGAYDNNTEMWGILDANIDPLGGVLSATVTHNDPYDPSMCVFVLNDVEQVFPQPDTPADDGQVNGDQSTSPSTPFTASTTITTTQNNALVFSVVSNGANGAIGTGDYVNVSPEPPISRLFNGPDSTYFIFAGSSGFVPSAGAITIDETPDNTNMDRYSQIVAAFNPLISGPPVAVGYEPVTLFQTYSGNLSYRTIAASLRTSNNAGGACNAGTSASASLILPELDETALAGYVDPVPGDQTDSTVLAAYLYWFGSGDVSAGPPYAANYDQVNFIDPSLTNTGITADEVFSIENVGGGNNLNYYAAWKDVTPLVTGNGTYEVQNLDAEFGTPWSTTSACAGGWALSVVYDNPFEQLRVINLFHGFQPFQNSAFTLVPRNFRMSSPDPNGEVPNGLVTHVTVEGDETIFNGDESLKMQDAPGSTDPNNFIPLTTDYNPSGAEFNGTITRPVFVIQDIDPTAGFDYKYQWDSTANGVNQSGGYEIDFPGPDSPPGVAGDELGASWGVDADTHYISGDEATPDVDDNLLYPFATSNAEEITTRYSSGTDLVLLVSEIISVTNAPIADLEIFVSETSSPYKVNTTGTYQVDVTNNGNGATSYGEATGNLTVTGVLPAGYTFAAAGDVAGTGWTCSVTLSPGAFTCDYDIQAVHGAGGLNQATPTANPLSFTVQIAGPPSNFPSLNNDAKVIVRMQHNDGTCTPEAPGVMPNPAGCESPEFDNVNDLQGGIIDIDDLDDKTGNNNNVHSVTTNVKGVETNLSITKTLLDVLEEDSPNAFADFELTVVNLGPDDITPSLVTPTITVADTEPNYIEFDSVATDPGWSCAAITNPGSTDLDCDFSGTLLVGNSTTITLTVEVTGTAGQLVSNTASVTSGLYNFDIVPGNNSSSDGGTIQSPPASATERFLMSVSSALNLTTLGSGGGQLVDFEDDDLIIFDPVLDEAVMFLDNSVEGFGLNDINAVHLLPNGQIILSTASASTVGDNNFAFDANDLVIYDPITRQGSLLFDGDSETETTGENIDAVYVLDNGDIVFSTAADVAAGIGWSDSDLVRYDGSSFSIYLDAEDDNVFDAASVNVDAAYIRVDPADATQVIDTYIFSSADEGATVGDDNSVFGRDDVVELTVDASPTPTSSSSENLFRGNIPIGVFSAFDAARTISALHIVEDSYLGHFSIEQSQAGSACTAGKITITKHQQGGGDAHQVDTDYTGSIRISLDGVADGDWSLDVGNGTLDNGTADDGIAIYTFSALDNGQVTLNLDVTEAVPVAKTVNVNVTNGFVDELGTEDDNFNFNLVITTVSYADNFDLAAFDNNDGTTGWSNDWQEIDGFDGVSAGSGAGPNAGNVQISGSTLSLTSNPNTDGNFEPSLEREADLSLFNANQTTFLDFDYSYSSLNLSDQVIVEVSDDGGANWETAADLTGLSGTNGSPTNVNVNLSTLGGQINDFTGTMGVRFRVANGYTLASTLFIHNVELSTGTTDCGIGVIDHFDIIVATTGIACVASTVTIVGHDANHFPAEPGNGTIINLSTSTGAGTWASILSGAGSLVDIGGPGTNTDGQGNYTFLGTEDTVQLQFNYTDPAGDSPTLSFNIGGTYTELNGIPDHDPAITFDEAGILFYNETTSNTALPFQIAGKPSMTAPSTGTVTIQLVRSVDVPGENESLACESLVGNGTTATITLAAVCEDPSTCAVSNMSVWDVNSIEQSIPVFNSPTANPEASGSSVDLEFIDQPTVVEGENNIGATLDFAYPDAGTISLHGQFEIPFDDDIAGVLSGDFITGSTASPFVVRPFGFDIDFDADRRSNGGVASVASDHTGPPFARAGLGFNATVSAVVWQSADDADQDGLPDFEADLSDNAITQNFGNETAVADHTVIVSVITDDPNVPGVDDNPGVPGGTTGSVLATNEAFSGFSGGSSTQLLAIDEVGIFDLAAILVDDAGSQNPINYLGAADDNGVEAGATGMAANVGRIYPNNFELVSASFGPRVNQSMACAMSSPFTYLGEEFGLNMVIQAKNALGNDTVNYIDDFAKLTSFSELDIRAIIDEAGAADNDLGAKLVNTTIASNFAGSWTDGELTLSGNMNLARQGSGAEEAPLQNVQIAFGPIDDNDDGVGGGNDVVLDVLDVDLDDGVTEPGTNAFKLISTHEFRYGRLMVENAFGPETEDLGVPLRIEYFDGTDFITNIDDSCTSFLYDVVAPSPALEFIVSSYEAPLADGDIEIESGEVADVEINLYEGVTNRQQDGDSDDTNDPDRPFLISAPDPLADMGITGRVLIEFDLNNPTLNTPLDFLSYDWRSDPEVDVYDEIPDGDYSNNPRGMIEFGSFRGHDRVINWQEIYIQN